MVVKHCKKLLTKDDQTIYLFIYLFWNYEDDIDVKIIKCVQKCVNLMKAINYAQQDTIAFCTHCHISS
jgi:hypothetical protein